MAERKRERGGGRGGEGERGRERGGGRGGGE